MLIKILYQITKVKTIFFSHFFSFFFVKIVRIGQRREYLLIMISASIMNRILTISAIAMFAVVMGVSAFAPAMAAKDTAPGQNKVYICHVEHDDPDTPDVDESSIDLIHVPENSAHFQLDKDGNPKHPDDFAPTDVGEGVLECIPPA